MDSGRNPENQGGCEGLDLEEWSRTTDSNWLTRKQNSAMAAVPAALSSTKFPAEKSRKGWIWPARQRSSPQGGAFVPAMHAFTRFVSPKAVLCLFGRTWWHEAGDNLVERRIDKPWVIHTDVAHGFSFSFHFSGARKPWARSKIRLLASEAALPSSPPSSALPSAGRLDWWATRSASAPAHPACYACVELRFALKRRTATLPPLLPFRRGIHSKGADQPILSPYLSSLTSRLIMSGCASLSEPSLGSRPLPRPWPRGER
jgi:hypothetical protein